MKTHREKATWREKVVICKPRTEAFRETKSVVWMKKTGSMDSHLTGHSDHKFLTVQIMVGSHSPGI